jgi:nucleoside-diphosphate-sugar epimerase
VKIIVTGASGFIGQHVLSKLLGAGHTVVAIVRPGSEGKLTSRSGLLVVKAELSALTKEPLAGAQVLIHLAAAGVVSGGEDWERCFAANVTDSLYVWQTAVQAGVRRLVICGSCFEYGNSALRYDFIPVDAPLEPTGAYHSSKAAATMAALGLAVALKLEVVVLRPFHVFGEGEAASRFWPALRRAALAGADFPMSGGEQMRDFISVDTVAEVFVRSLSEPLAPGVPKIANVGTGVPQSLAQFARHWWQQWGATGSLKLGVLPYRANEVMRYVPDLTTS